MTPYDVIVIGGGHAGTESAAAAARTGARTLLLTQNLETIGQMSCNPAIGGIAKGTVVREVDALGGIMGRATDRAMIQFRMLNRSKGPAVWSPRAQCDRGLYRRAVRSLLEEQASLAFAQGTVVEVLVSGAGVRGVRTREGQEFAARAVVITAGTFLRGTIHLGRETRIPAGRAGDAPSIELSQAIVKHGLTVERFKTGTPPRIDGRSIDLGGFPRQDGDAMPYWFSSLERHPRLPQLPCYLAWAGASVRSLIEAHLGESALYGGEISGRGPRYCPSIEDKIVKFGDAERHQLFLEPEGLDTAELYVNGLSTSLPFPVQEQMVHAVPGLELARITRPGYAIEYDYLPPTQLHPSLESRVLPGLYFAGQVNGTTGYEEAAGQGLMAGLNAARAAQGETPVVLRRDQAMIGVLIDDLVTRGVDEPYRLFTSRAEYRLLLRQDNALRRLFAIGEATRLLDDTRLRQVEQRLREEEQVFAFARETVISPAAANPLVAKSGSAPLLEPTRVREVARRPGVSLPELLALCGWSGDPELAQWAEIEIKYEGYLEREREGAARMASLEDFLLDVALDYPSFHSLSTEARHKLAAVRPGTLGGAGRIPGISPSDLQNLVIEVQKWRRHREVCAPPA
ncbi:MAG: tRNA uridine-5-carboxymethylaminomethyl(34) synthesis enzyme MnmG [Gemmatimonadetes bacterium]|nr:tRNA uridine-5-carboxymethylaminomethyl(34) synthesis enzyme MnmG [Gemmatimonadota bacterium]MBK6780732.1 tRNA uridine-5-carboxymethylaminomethyl(34) synthesis enzyme MnmG [Gemmatimonadota bacterium]MBK7716957.1 tRNA uridine-5-carboxymethylaminomethyl(34) synthesis enzyme MnmG [Gemmatimonadota bacterium]MBK7923097.1 tRNA uridine-5-carboxymethylaminomethyl(34) synthesis enzyme MnmG [Gemmatimonadota bacterium]MBK9066152.1 tRNA uridine-5-carboxymethylaminomethyl(34) synthesis enzyme MnmG [Gemma